MFVWAMRDKGSEWRAVRHFRSAGRLPFTPLVEAVCEPYLVREGEVPKSPTVVLRGLGEKLGTLADSGRVWVDLSNLVLMFSPKDVGAFHELVRQGLGLATHLVTPVIRTSSPVEMVDAAFEWARRDRCGLCIRVDGATHLTDKGEAVTSLAASSGVAQGDIDLVFDAQDLPRAVSYEELEEHFPLSLETRTWTVLAGTFPSSITDMSLQQYVHRRERDEWSTWIEEFNQGTVRRVPTYGDYATQSSIYRPSPPFPGSPSVRYSTGTEYVVLRGRGSPDGRVDYRQYIGHALYLSQQPYFREVCSTEGDKYVERIATRTQGTGNLSTWRVASLQRHLSVVAEQVARVEAVVQRRR